ncbi:hypothetical protein CPAST_c34210 [Clostridium pasteurianum DSM 525 = ATCC 6013]|uniref:Uncharacterized protein n=1 Tax=Clostridium pasteurianum DSM 525 = ATCC 6013 TaxID=1262449 RepID=A0A0H3J8E0_CLOPA|nr:hypothetical protein [Clostridium pasteurianum]AJA49487.1 hypothetical protein CPAST_c34210 [Clostridium pasteurianum DSM 525 = ATCC 6013]AJA53475.1 hypothetical protein CLPA_c34210 [Clostridium pasteurianum DSM 525 = ATCC 6013]ELP58398.1 hypothetical protein F502_14270 [Clostridium pasteurianum DSM 525 = ATCC 6013]KRU14500.1 hypothetical protein CP6013_03759 [Clostridium pasteurianum DSM 525 = ATCC 6013]
MGVGSLVKINDNNSWNGLYGIVRYLVNDVAFIFCVQHPTDLYIAKKDNDIILIEE